MRYALRFTAYLIVGVLFVLLMQAGHMLDGWGRWAKALVVVAFALGMLHGAVRRRRA